MRNTSIYICFYHFSNVAIDADAQTFCLDYEYFRRSSTDLNLETDAYHYTTREVYFINAEAILSDSMGVVIHGIILTMSLNRRLLYAFV